MSVVDLTLKDKEFVPFWNESCAEKSSELWLPIVTDSADLDPTSSNTYYHPVEVNSWFSMTNAVPLKKNSLTTCLQLSQYLQQEVTDLENTKPKLNPKSKILTRKIEIKPTKEQRNKLSQSFGVCRWFYNKSVEILNRPGQIASLKQVWAIIKEEGIPDWANTCPYDAYYQAVKDAVQAMQILKRMSKKDKKPRSLKYRSKRGDQNLYINRLNKQGCGYPRMLGVIRSTEEVKSESIGKSARICLKNGKYYLTTTFNQEQMPLENQERIIALDPGIRSFLSFYDSIGNNGFIGRNDIGRIQRLCFHLDELISKLARSNSNKKKKSLEKAIQRMRRRMKDLVSDMHWKIAKYLVTNYDYILLPKFETQQMSKRSKRKLSRKSTRAMLTLSHYSFRCKLEHLCWKHKKTLVICNEAYTSKTNTCTGIVDMSLRNKRIIDVPDGFIDRDINGARNILIRALVNSPSIKTS